MDTGRSAQVDDEVEVLVHDEPMCRIDYRACQLKNHGGDACRHTDNVGGYEHNMGLSLRRAEAVVKELTTRHGIPATRLKAAGTGPLAPMAPNETEQGRAKNRRVELVQQ
jgi:hypothetical protein